MRIGFYGHAYHRATGSSRFLVEALRSLGAVEEHCAGDPEFDLEQFVGAGFDAVVVWQVECVALRLAQAGHPNTTFFPMYDSCHAYPDSYWRHLSGLKVVSFSSVLQARLQRLGVRARFARYFPEVPREQVSDSPGLAGYFWQRQQDVTWATIRALIGKTRFRQFTLHDALDPECGTLASPGGDEALRLHLRTTRWFPNRVEARADLLSHNVYFAPRLREGIGMSFLEAMASGFLVVAPDRPTMNEYITSGVNGLLYDPCAPAPRDFADHRRMGRRARQSIEAGHERWRRVLPPLLEVVAMPTREVPIQAPLGALDPLSFGFRGRTPRQHTWSSGPPTAPSSSESGPLVTVAMIGPFDGSRVQLAALESVLVQDWKRIELLLLGYDPGDEAEVLSRVRASRVERLRTLRCRGSALLLNDGAEAATGDYLLFLSHQEVLTARDTISSVVRGAPPVTDLIVGHCLKSDDGGGEEICQSAEPFQAYESLRRGEIDLRWIDSFPTRSAVLWRPSLLRRCASRTNGCLLVHEDAVLQAVQQGARVHHALELVSTCPEVRRSVRERRRLLDAWLEVASLHTGRPDALRGAFQRMRSEMRTCDLHRLPWMELLLSVARVPGAFRELKRRLRARRALAREARASASPSPLPLR